MVHPGRWGRYPTTGRPVSASSIGRSVLYKDSEQSLSRMPTMRLGVRNCKSPCSSAARVMLDPFGCTTSSTGSASVSASSHALARVVSPCPS